MKKEIPKNYETTSILGLGNKVLSEQDEFCPDCGHKGKKINVAR